MKYQENLLKYWLFLAFSVISCSLSAQNPGQPKVLLDVPPDTFYTSLGDTAKNISLPVPFIIPGSERIYLGKFKFLPGIHYTIDYNSGRIELLQSFTSKDSLKIIYRKYPFPLLPEYHHRELQVAAPDDTTRPPGETEFKEVSSKFLDEVDLYQSNLQKSGSISRGFEIGNNKDLTLNSGLNLQLSGYITPRVELVAALTDESTPIQPEGNTQTLNEVDQVFVKITSPYVGGTLGDFNLKYLSSKFGNVQRKLQGITVNNPYKSTHQQVTFGTSRGTFHTNQFLGKEGVQGPYQLTGTTGEKEIIVLAGTERVFVDGVRQIRGENNDYTIDYSLAQITFTNKRLITAENRIEVDFEFTAAIQRYGKNFVGASTRGDNLANRINYDFRYFREWDDTNNLLEDSAPLSDEEKEALKKAGDDPLAASVSGAKFVGAGNGTYVLVLDTLVGGLPYDSVYRYVGSGLGDYRVIFTGVGQGNGTYRRVRLGVYDFVGSNNGEYLPIRLVPLAGNKNFFDFGLGVKLTGTARVDGEIAVSNFDKNIFSDIDNGDNTSDALRLSAALENQALKFLGKAFGNLSLNARWLRQKKNFSPLDRFLQPQYDYKWNLSQVNLSDREESIESNMMYQPVSFLKFSGNLGAVKRGASTSSNRGSAHFSLSNNSLPAMDGSLEFVSSKNNIDKSDWLREGLIIQKQFGKFLPRLSFKSEDRKVTDAGGKITGFRFKELQGTVNIRELWAINWNLHYQLKPDMLYDPKHPGRTMDQATTQTVALNGEIKTNERWQGRFSFVFRDKNYTDFFKNLPKDSIPVYQPDPQFQDTVWQDRKSRIANFELQYRAPANIFVGKWNYQVATELQALLEKVYVDVGENNGNFRFDETLQEYVPDPQGNFILFILPTGDFEGITNLETGLQLQYRPKFKRKSNFTFKDILNNISYTGYFKIEEKSNLDNIFDLYILNLNKFHTPEHTLQGAFIINQDLYFFERNPDWGLQFRSRFRDNLFNQFLDQENNETRVTWDRAVQVRKRIFGRKLNLSLEYLNSLSKRTVSSVSSRNNDILGHNFTVGLNYRPSYAWRILLNLEGGPQKDRNEANLLKLNVFEIRPQISYSLRGKARATADVSTLIVEEVENPFNRPIPFEMAKGKKAGVSWLWNARFDYFISNNVTITANYTGRKDATALKVIHLGKAEVRAFF